MKNTDEFEEKIKVVYLILGVVLFILLLIFLVLNILGFMLNPYFFTWDKEKCIKNSNRFSGILCDKRPPLLRPLDQ